MPAVSSSTLSDIERRLAPFEQAVNSAEARVRLVWFTLTSLTAYVFVAFLSTSHEDMLLQSRQKLPLLQIELPLDGFALIGPVLLLLVAPVLDPGADRRAVQLPRGRWYDTVTEEAFEGPAQVLVDAPLSRIPVFARAGAVLPVRGADGSPELEVWAPARGRTGGGLVVPDAGDGWDEPETERYVARRQGREVVVTREREDGSGEPPYPVRVRGLG